MQNKGQSYLLREWGSLVCAFAYFTRLKLPLHKYYAEENMNGAAKYLPLVGWLVGGMAAGVYWGAIHVMPAMIALLLAVISQLFLTGALHEDGFADVCDAFGGGWTKERILEIMKDSNVGVFGLVGILLLLALKMALLAYIPSSIVCVSFIAGASLSRAAAVSMMFTNDYARSDDSSKSKQVAVRMSFGDFLFVLIVGILPLLLFQEWYVLGLLPVIGIVRYLMGRYFKKWIGGYTGDCLGAIQQVSEVVVYLYILIYLWNFI